MASREYHREYSREYYHRRRSVYIGMLGGKCTSCGSESELQFDHVDPSTKSFPMAKILNVSKARAEDELKKCQLLCKSCHEAKSLVNGDTLRRRIARGTDIGSSVLDDQIVLDIRKKQRNGASVKDILAAYPGVKKSTMRCVLAGRTWRHVQYTPGDA